MTNFELTLILNFLKEKKKQKDELASFFSLNFPNEYDRIKALSFTINEAYTTTIAGKASTDTILEHYLNLDREVVIEILNLAYPYKDKISVLPMIALKILETGFSTLDIRLVTYCFCLLSENTKQNIDNDGIQKLRSTIFANIAAITPEEHSKRIKLFAYYTLYFEEKKSPDAFLLSDEMPKNIQKKIIDNENLQRIPNNHNASSINNNNTASSANEFGGSDTPFSDWTHLFQLTPEEENFIFPLEPSPINNSNNASSTNEFFGSDTPFSDWTHSFQLTPEEKEFIFPLEPPLINNNNDVSSNNESLEHDTPFSKWIQSTPLIPEEDASRNHLNSPFEEPHKKKQKRDETNRFFIPHQSEKIEYPSQEIKPQSKIAYIPRDLLTKEKPPTHFFAISEEEKIPTNYSNTHEFCSLENYADLNMFHNVSPQSIWQFSRHGTKLFFYTKEDCLCPTQDETVTFVFSTKKIKTQIPDLTKLGEKQRIILVLSRNEFSDYQYCLKKICPEFLVIDSLESITHGVYQNLDGMQAKRLASFLASYNWKLKDCIYLEEKISGISFNHFSNDHWESIANLLKETREKNNNLISGMRTILPRQIVSKKRDIKDKYTYKICSLNFSFIAELLSLKTPDDVFILGLPAPFEKYAVDNYYFQMIIDFSKSQQTNKNLSITIGLKKAGLIPLKAHQRFIKLKPALVNELLSVEDNVFVPPLLISPQKEIVKQTFEHLKKSILDSEKRIKKQDLENNNNDILHILSHNNKIKKKDIFFESLNSELLPPTNNKTKKRKTTNKFSLTWLETHSSDKSMSTLFSNYESFKKLIEEHLYPHQKDAVYKISCFNGKKGIVKMPTGSGKTRLEFILTFFLISNDPACKVYIVTDTLQLVNQLYAECIEMFKKLNRDDLIEKTVKISSETNLAISVFDISNYPRINECNLLIFCSNSYFKMMEKPTLYQSIAPTLTFLDEFHLYKKNALTLLNHEQLTILALSATPPENISIPIIYTYSREESLRDGITSPLIIRVLDKTFENTESLDEIIPIIKNYRHPTTGEPLFKCKGIIYVHSIPDAEYLAGKINQNFLEYNETLATAAHSSNKNSKNIIENFRKKNFFTFSILVVVEMFTTGTDDRELAWEVIARSNRKNEALTTQMIGRVIRTRLGHEEKIGLVLVDKRLKISQYSILMDDLAIETAHENYFKENCEALSNELKLAIRLKLGFDLYRVLFTQKKLSYLNLSQHVELLLEALQENNEDWAEQLIIHNMILRNSPTHPQYSLCSFFLNTVSQKLNHNINCSSYYSAANFEKLLYLLRNKNLSLFKQNFRDMTIEYLIKQINRKDRGWDKSLQILQKAAREFSLFYQAPTPIQNTHQTLSQFSKPS